MKNKIKTLNTIADLAISGAPPAFVGELYVGTPNIGDRNLYFKLMNEVFDRKWLSNNGPLVQAFEDQLQRYLGVDHAIAVCNGTVGIELALRALNLEGEIIVPSYTFIATAHAPYWHGLSPVFVDIDPYTHLIQASTIENHITSSTSAILATHLWGNPADIKLLQKIADDFGLALIFDAAHAFGSSYKGKMIGNFGKCEIFSFHATKFLNTFEGGAICTNDSELAKKLRLMRNFGFSGFDSVQVAGTNAKMTESCAAMGLCNMSSISSIIENNKSHYELYRKNLRNTKGVRLIEIDKNERHNYQYIVMELNEDFPIRRDDLVDILWKENVIARRYFWPGCHNMEPYKTLYKDSNLSLPNTDHVASNVVTLPTGMSITDNDIDVICRIIDISAGFSKEEISELLPSKRHEATCPPA